MATLLTRRGLLAAALLLACTCCTLCTVEADQRSVLMNVGGKPPASLGQAGLNIMHGMPRYGGASNQLGDVQNYSDAQKYAIGLLVPIAVAFLLALLSWSTCAGFCLGRGSCNGCGGRVADRAYSSKDQLPLKLIILVIFFASIVLFGIGLVSNAAISSSLDDSYSRSDALVEYLYTYNAPVRAINQATASALATVQALNSSVYSQLPDPLTIASWDACSQAMFDTVQLELTLLNDLAPLTGSSASGSSSSSGTNFTQLANSMLQEQSLIAGVPNLRPDAASLVAYNQSLAANLPSPLYAAGALPASVAYHLQANGRVAKSVGDSIPNQLNPAFASTSPTISPVQNGLTSYDAANAQSPLSAVNSLIAHISTGDHSAATVNEVNNLNRSVSLLPSQTAFTNAVNAFNTQFRVLATLTYSITASIDALALGVNGFASGVPFSNLLTALQSKVNNVAHAANLPANLDATATALANLQSSTAALILSVSSSTTSVASLRNSTDLANTMQAVNTSLPAINCIKPVFNQLIALNNSVLTLPPRVGGVLNRRTAILLQLQRLQRIQYDLTLATSNLVSLGQSLSTFPNLTAIAQGLSALNSALLAFPDCHQAANEIRDLDSALAQLTPAYLSNLQSNFPNFVSAVNTASSSILSMDAALIHLRDTVSSFPPNFNVFTNFAATITGAASGMASNLQQVLTQVNQAGFTSSTGIQDPLKTNFLANLNAYKAALATFPDTLDLENSLSWLQGNMSATQSAEGSIQTTLTNFQTAAQAMPDMSAVDAAMSRAYTNTTTSPLGVLLTGVPHLALNATITAVPNLSGPAAVVAATGNATAAQGPVMSLVAQDLSSAYGFMDAQDLADIKSGLNAIKGLITGFPDLNSPLNSLSIAKNGLSNADTSMTQYRHEYYVARQSTVVFKNHIDWLRLLGYMLVLFVPICVAACGLTAWIGKKPKCSMYMGMCSFSIMAIFFVMTAIQVGPAMLFADQCSNFDQFIATNLANYGLSPSAAQPWINLTESTTAVSLYNYFSSCNGPKPQLVQVFADPQKVLADNSINFTDYRVRVQNTLASNNNTVGLLPPVWSYFYSLDDDTQAVIQAALGANALFDCSASSAVWEPLVNSVCSSSGVAGAVALSTCVCFLFAVCMMPAVCVGIIGYKRFDPENFGAQRLLSPIKDPYAAGLAERPAHHAPDGMASPTSPGASPSQLASPSAPPLDGGVELGQVRLQEHVGSHRQSLEMALNSSPPAYHEAHQPPHAAPHSQPAAVHSVHTSHSPAPVHPVSDHPQLHSELPPVQDPHAATVVYEYQ